MKVINSTYKILFLYIIFFIVSSLEIIRLQFKANYFNGLQDVFIYYFVSSLPFLFVLIIFSYVVNYFWNKLFSFVLSTPAKLVIAIALLILIIWNYFYFQWNIQLLGFGTYFYTSVLILFFVLFLKIKYKDNTINYNFSLLLLALISLFVLKQNQNILQIIMRKHSYSYLLLPGSVAIVITLYFLITLIVKYLPKLAKSYSDTKLIKIIFSMLILYLLFHRLISVKVYLAQYRFWILLIYLFIVFFIILELNLKKQISSNNISRKKKNFNILIFAKTIFIVLFISLYIFLLRQNLTFSRSYYFRKYPSIINLSLPFRYILDFDHDGYLAIFGENDIKNTDAKSTPLSFRPKGKEKIQLEPLAKYKNILLNNKSIPIVNLTKKKYNILALSIDSWRADRFQFSKKILKENPKLKYLNYKKNIIPNINKLVNKSIFFSNTYTSYPRTNPAMIAFSYGAYSYSEPNLKKSLFSYFKDKGYRIKFLAGSYPHYKFTHKYISEFKGPYRKKGRKDIKANEMIKRIQKEFKKSKPAFIWAHFMEPHIGYIKHKKFNFGNSRKNRYNSELAFVDFYIGKLLANLEKSNILENTIILLFADHGENLGEESLYGHSLWLRPESIHIPFMIILPDMENIKKPIFVTDRIGITDILPFILQKYLAVNLAKPYKNSLFNTQNFYLKSDIDLAVIDGDYLLILNSLFPGIYGLPKMVQYMELKLYNLSKNPFSKKDISSEFPILTWEIYNRNKKYFQKISKQRNRVSFK